MRRRRAILQAAREGSAAIRTKAEDGAARLLREAGEESQRVREEAELEASRKRTDALADAEAELTMAKQQGREMVEEARAYRERVLSELSRRRDLARQQLEQLVHGRDRLLQAFERARLVSVDVVAELTPFGEPDEYVDLSPTTARCRSPSPRRAWATPPRSATTPCSSRRRRFPTPKPSLKATLTSTDATMPRSCRSRQPGRRVTSRTTR